MRELLSVKIDEFLGKKKSPDTWWVFDRYLLGGYNGEKNDMRHFGKMECLHTLQMIIQVQIL
jgi:hypothetical protein